MTEIVWEEFLGINNLLQCIQIVKDGLNSFTFSEQTPLPPGVAGIDSRNFKSKEEAATFAEESYIPGRRSQGWTFKELG